MFDQHDSRYGDVSFWIRVTECHRGQTKLFGSHEGLAHTEHVRKQKPEVPRCNSRSAPVLVVSLFVFMW